MADEESVVSESITNTEAQNDYSSKLQQAMWGDGATASTAENGEQQNNQEASKQDNQNNDVQESIEDAEVWFKEQFKDYGFESIDKAKEVIADWKKAKETPIKEEITFENDESKVAYQYIKEGKWKELNNHLALKDKVDTYATAEVTPEIAADIIKLNMRLKNERLTKDDIDFNFKQLYTPPKEPKEPVKKDIEDDDDFNERHSEWKERHDEWKEYVDNINRKKILDAKMIQPELEKLKTQIVLPDITNKDSQSNQPSQEDLKMLEKISESFLKSYESAVNDFKGFNAQVKDKDVDYSVSYAPSKEEKAVIIEKMKSFSEKNFDANAIFAERWLTQDGTINVNQMTEDLSKILFDSAKVNAKLVNDAANERLNLYLKGKKNINFNQPPNGTFQPDNRNQSEKLAEKFWGTP